MRSGGLSDGDELLPEFLGQSMQRPLFAFVDLRLARQASQSASLLALLTTHDSVGIMANMQATLVARTRIVYAESAFAELVLWKVPSAAVGSSHEFKYRLAYVVDGVCVVRYDNEVGEGDHRHCGEKESEYSFSTPEALLAAFERDMARWNREDSHS